MDRKKVIFGICYQIVLKIYKKLHLWKIPVPGRDRVRADLNQLYPGENTEERITEYYVTKLTMWLPAENVIPLRTAGCSGRTMRVGRRIIL